MLTKSVFINIYSGAGKRSRTPDLMITNQLLYQLSYAGVGANYRGYGAIGKR